MCFVQFLFKYCFYCLFSCSSFSPTFLFSSACMTVCRSILKLIWFNCYRIYFKTATSTTATFFFIQLIHVPLLWNPWSELISCAFGTFSLREYFHLLHLIIMRPVSHHYNQGHLYSPAKLHLLIYMDVKNMADYNFWHRQYSRILDR